MATTLLPSSIEGFMGLREKHPVYYNEKFPIHNILKNFEAQ